MLLRTITTYRSITAVLSVVLLFGTSFSAAAEKSCSHESAHLEAFVHSTSTCPDGHYSEECSCEKAHPQPSSQKQTTYSETPRVKIQQFHTIAGERIGVQDSNQDQFRHSSGQCREHYLFSTLSPHITSTILLI